jgi:N-acetylglucosamine malate deacetylase 1
LKAHHKIPPVFFMDTVMGLGFVPTEFVDISATFAAKRRMLARHKSQLRWLTEHDRTDILDSIEVVARYRGLQCGVTYAEAFAQHEVWGRKTPTRLLP